MLLLEESAAAAIDWTVDGASDQGSGDRVETTSRHPPQAAQ
jgi:hypothetical protein